jgi:hypothetical protein
MKINCGSPNTTTLSILYIKLPIGFFLLKNFIINVIIQTKRWRIIIEKALIINIPDLLFCDIFSLYSRGFKGSYVCCVISIDVLVELLTTVVVLVFTTF